MGAHKFIEFRFWGLGLMVGAHEFIELIEFKSLGLGYSTRRCYSRAPDIPPLCLSVCLSLSLSHPAAALENRVVFIEFIELRARDSGLRVGAHEFIEFI